MFLVLVRRCVLDVCHTPYYQAVRLFGRILEENELTGLIRKKIVFVVPFKLSSLSMLILHINQYLRVPWSYITVTSAYFH